MQSMLPSSRGSRSLAIPYAGPLMQAAQKRPNPVTQLQPQVQGATLGAAQQAAQQAQQMNQAAGMGGQLPGVNPPAMRRPLPKRAGQSPRQLLGTLMARPVGHRPIVKGANMRTPPRHLDYLARKTKRANGPVTAALEGSNPQGQAVMPGGSVPMGGGPGGPAEVPAPPAGPAALPSPTVGQPQGPAADPMTAGNEAQMAEQMTTGGEPALARVVARLLATGQAQGHPWLARPDVDPVRDAGYEKMVTASDSLIGNSIRTAARLARRVRA